MNDAQIALMTVIVSTGASVITAIIAWWAQRPKVMSESEIANENARVAGEAANEAIFKRQTEALNNSEVRLANLEIKMKRLEKELATEKELRIKEKDKRDALLNDEREKTIALGEALATEKERSKELVRRLTMETRKRRVLEEDVYKLEARIALLEKHNERLQEMLDIKNKDDNGE